MKKLLIVICIFIGLVLFPATASADSPLTSTEFYLAYQDVDIVKEACETQKMNSDIARYLADSGNPIDMKTAVINALYLNLNSKSNAEEYCRIVYKKPLADINTDDLSGDQLLCIGYLLSLDDYENPVPALKYLKLAEKKINDSFTVSVIRAIAESMKPEDNPWEYIKPLLQNSNLSMDMRQNAVNIILDYMASYCDSEEVQVSKNNVMIKDEKNQTIYLYGTFTSDKDQCPYEIVKSSNIAYTSLSRDQYGIYYVSITGIKNGSSSIKIENDDGKSVTINFDVVSKNTYSKLTNTLALYVGNITAYIGKTKETMSELEKPFLKDNLQYIPIAFCSKAEGASYKYDSKALTYKIFYGHKSIVLKSGSKTASVNGKAFILLTKPIVKNGTWFITLQDFSKLINKKYIYDNGLIFIADKALQLDTVSDDYILDEIASLITNNKRTFHEPVVFLNNGKYGYKDYKGNIIIKPSFNKAYNFNDGLAVVSVINSEGKEKYGYIDVTGKFIIKPIYDAAYSFAGGLAPILNEQGTLWGFIDVSGKLVISYSYTNCKVFQYGLAAVQIDDKWGYIDETGKIVIQPVYEKAASFSDGLAVVKQNNSEYNITVSEMAVFFYDNGNVYAGEVKDGLPSGSGVYTWASGIQYIGSFLEGKITGKGVRTETNGTVTQGYWIDGIYHGDK